MNTEQCNARISEKQINEPSPVILKYPQVEGLQNKAVESRINSKIQSIVQKLIASQIEPPLPSPDFNLSTFEGTIFVLDKIKNLVYTCCDSYLRLKLQYKETLPSEANPRVKGRKMVF